MPQSALTDSNGQLDSQRLEDTALRLERSHATNLTEGADVVDDSRVCLFWINVSKSPLNKLT